MIRATNILKKYGEGELELTVLKDINLEIQDGEFVAIIGPSGAGKSTLLYQISLLDEPTSGEIFIDEVDTSKLSQTQKTALRLNKLGYVFQDYALLPELTALENVGLPMIMQGMTKKEAYEKAKKALSRIGLGEKFQNLPNQLSGGQQQRVSIARAIAHDPKILFADEPTGNLDSKTGTEIMALFEDLARKGNTIIVVTHEEEIARHARRILRIRDGLIASDELVGGRPG